MRPLSLAARLAPLRLAVDAAIDAGRHRIDTFPWTYHPTSSSSSASRSEGTVSRWLAMREFLVGRDVQTAIDIGCNGGWFVLRLAESGVLALGVDGDRRFTRMLVYEASKRGLPVQVLMMHVNPETVKLLPRTDCILFLSVWHHTVRTAGLEQATKLLATLWARTERVFFFDTGEDEMPASFGLPSMRPSSQQWISDYLTAACTGGDVHHLGTHRAFAPDGTEAERNLFAVERQSVDATHSEGS